eukprot:4998254-Pleurochrysis_carterae.AAC.1
MSKVAMCPLRRRSWTSIKCTSDDCSLSRMLASFISGRERDPSPSNAVRRRRAFACHASLSMISSL